MSIDLKYFVLKPKSKRFNDPYADASRKAMVAYAEAIKLHNLPLHDELLVWVAQELANDIDLGVKRFDITPNTEED